MQHVKPEKVGVSKAELDELNKKTKENLLERVDLNWIQDKTMRDKPKYMSEQLSSDKNFRYGRYYLTLEKEARQGQ